MSQQQIPSGDFQQSPKEGQDETRDPYRNEDPPTEPLRCPDCGNIYRDDKWSLFEQVSDLDAQSLETYRCPGCRKIRDNYYLGEVRLQGSYLSKHRDEISGLIDNEVERDQQKNPLAKIVEAFEKDGEFRVRTTNAKLAERVGRKLHQAHGGEVEFDESEHITRVYWTRDTDS